MLFSCCPHVLLKNSVLEHIPDFLDQGRLPRWFYNLEIWENPSEWPSQNPHQVAAMPTFEKSMALRGWWPSLQERVDRWGSTWGLSRYFQAPGLPGFLTLCSRDGFMTGGLATPLWSVPSTGAKAASLPDQWDKGKLMGGSLSTLPHTGLGHTVLERPGTNTGSCLGDWGVTKENSQALACADDSQADPQWLGEGDTGSGRLRIPEQSQSSLRSASLSG